MTQRELIQARRDVGFALVQLKDRAMRLDLYRTGRLIDIATQELGWELQGIPTPAHARDRQDETLRP